MAALAAGLALSAAALAAPWETAGAASISAQTFVLHNSWDISRIADDADAAEPGAATNGAVLTVSGPGGVLAASASPADGPPIPTGAHGSPTFVPSVSVAHDTLPFPGQLGLRPAVLSDRLLFTPTTGGPAIALQLFFPAPLDEPDITLGAGGAAEQDLFRLLKPIGDPTEAGTAGQRLTSLHHGYLAQIAPDGLDSLREARCAAASPPPAGCEALDGEAESGSLLARLGLASIPLPPAVVLLGAALACLGAVAWRRNTPG